MGRMIGLLQVDPTVGDLTGNAQRLEHLSNLAAQHGASVGGPNATDAVADAGC